MIWRLPCAQLRLAWPLDESDRLDDANLRKFDWAQTIVRVDLESADMVAHLLQEIRAFPAEFLLFFPVETELVLETTGVIRAITVVASDDDRILTDSDAASRWRVVRRENALLDGSAAARALLS